MALIYPHPLSGEVGAVSSVVRAPVLHTGSQRFKPSTAHHKYKVRSRDLMIVWQTKGGQV